MTLPNSDRLLFLAILLGLGMAAGLSAAAWATGLMLYADGALFSFIIGVDDAWALVWHIMPARIAIYLLTVLPAEIAREWGLPALAAMRLYQALFIGFPFLGTAACLALVPRQARWLILFPTLSTLALAASALGYPTETQLTLSAFWPALFGYRYANGRYGRMALTVVFTAIFLYSHPGMIFTLPLLPLAALLRWRESQEKPIKRELLLLGGLTTLLLGLWIWRFRVEMSNPGIVQSSQHMWSLTNLQEVVRLQPMILVVLFYLLLWAALGWWEQRFNLWAAWGFPAVAVSFGLLHTETSVPESHYYVRTALIFILPLLGALALWRGRVVPRGTIAVAMIISLATTQLVHNLAFLNAWLNYRDSIIAATATGPARVVPLQQVLAAQAEPSGHSLAWSWGQPYLSLTLPGALPYTAIVADPQLTSYSPFRCSQMDAIIDNADWVPTETLTMLKAYVCARRPD